VEVTRKEQTHFTLSVSAYSMDEDEARDLAIKASYWFSFVGYDRLKSCNVVAISVTAIGDRTVEIVEDYEKRFGFDVRCRMGVGVTKRIETIEDHNFNAKINGRGQ
jgi:hypothetical protein